MPATISDTQKARDSIGGSVSKNMSKTMDTIVNFLCTTKHPFRQAGDQPTKARQHRYERRKIKEFLKLFEWRDPYLGKQLFSSPGVLTAVTTRRHHRDHWHSSRRASCVCLEFVHCCASQVSIAGSFNDWRPSVTPMISMGPGWWVKGLVLPPGRYEYRFVVDGQPMPDPSAAETVPAPDGQLNSVLVVRVLGEPINEPCSNRINREHEGFYSLRRNRL